MKRLKLLAAALAFFLIGCGFFNNTTESVTVNCQVFLTGGSGRASVESPAKVVDAGDEKTVELVWSSPYYDYMIVDGTRYENEAKEGDNSVFTIPFSNYDTEFPVIADTTAMSEPHEIEYQITVYNTDTADLKSSEDVPLEPVEEAYDLGGLSYDHEMDLEYASGFSVGYYLDSKQKEYKFVTIQGVGSSKTNQYFLFAPVGTNPKVSDNVAVITEPCSTYLVSTSVMDYISKIDSLDRIAFSGTKASDWYVKKAKKAMEDGQVLFAGKYSAPDYELLVSSGCDFAIENTMIFHNPEAKEKLEELGIPVMVETSSYEATPLGRLEWIKLYGAIYDKEDLATEVFDQQKLRVSQVTEKENTNKTVAFFSISSNGQITVRKSNDYISSMIKMAGGNYVPKDLYDSENALSTMKMTAEDFYLVAADADILIYNSTIEGELKSVQELQGKLQSLEDFKAIKNGEVYCLKEGYFQKSTSVAEFIEELHEILKGSYKSGECFYKLKE